MPNTILPTQIGYTPQSVRYPSQIVLGRDIIANFDAVGLGAGGRPDEMSLLRIYLTNPTTSAAVRQIGAFTLDVSQLLAITSGNPNAPQTFNFALREASVCEIVNGSSTEKAMMIIASQTYLPSGVA